MVRVQDLESIWNNEEKESFSEEAYAKAYDEIDKMNESKTVTPSSVVAWYIIHSDQLKKHFVLAPEKSLDDNLRAMELWMRISEKGGKDAFPFEYQAEYDPEEIEQVFNTKTQIFRMIGWVITFFGFLLMFSRGLWGALLLFIGFMIEYINYKLRLNGKAGSLYSKEIKKAAKWIKEHSY